jgi:hypothetical protein
LAPCKPGANPTISSRAFTGPNAGTGELNQSGLRPRQSSRNAFRRGQSAQSRSGLEEADLAIAALDLVDAPGIGASH